MNMNNYSENFLDLNPGIISFERSTRSEGYNILYISQAKYKINNSIENTIFLKTPFFGRNYGIPEMNEMFGSIRSRATIAFPLDYTNFEIKDFAENFKGAPGGQLREAARFAMSIGILNGAREERKDWKTKKVRTIAHLNGQFDQHGKYNMESLFDQLGLLVDDVKLNILIILNFIQIKVLH